MAPSGRFYGFYGFYRFAERADAGHLPFLHSHRDASSEPVETCRTCRPVETQRTSVLRQPLPRCLDLRFAWQKHFFERRRVRNRRIERADDADRRVEPFEALLLNHRGERLADAARPRVLVHDHHAAGVPRDREHGVEIERREPAQIEDGRFDARRGQALGDAEAHVNVRAVRDERQMVARAPEGRASDRQRPAGPPCRWPV